MVWRAHDAVDLLWYWKSSGERIHAASTGFIIRPNLFQITVVCLNICWICRNKRVWAEHVQYVFFVFFVFTLYWLCKKIFSVFSFLYGHLTGANRKKDNDYPIRHHCSHKNSTDGFKQTIRFRKRKYCHSKAFMNYFKRIICPWFIFTLTVTGFCAIARMSVIHGENIIIKS